MTKTFSSVDTASDLFLYAQAFYNSIKNKNIAAAKNLMMLAMTVKRPLHIVLADDDDDDRILFEEAVNEFSPEIKITCVEDGEELMSLLSAAKAKLPDLIFLDLNMPRKNGNECLAEIRRNAKLKEIPIIIYSTSSSKEHIEKTYKDGANLYVRKPYSFEDLKVIAEKVFNLNWDEYKPKSNKEKFILSV